MDHPALNQFIIYEGPLQHELLEVELGHAVQKVLALDKRMKCLEECKNKLLDREDLPGTSHEETMAILRQQINLMNQGKIAITIPEDIKHTETLFWQKNDVKERGEVAVDFSQLMDLLCVLGEKRNVLLKGNMKLQNKMLKVMLNGSRQIEQILSNNLTINKD